MLALKYHLSKIEVGVDEAGRGALAGAVTAAAVLLPDDFSHPLLNDSKKITPAKRLLMRSFIEENALDYAVTFVDENRIGEVNILNAAIEAMHLSLAKIKTPFEHIAVDGNRFKPFQKIPHTTLVKGDGKYAHIAAASILAKTYRDAYMQDLHKKDDRYHWHQNKGYPTLKHRKAIAAFGASIYHRKGFKLLPQK